MAIKAKAPLQRKQPGSALPRQRALKLARDQFTKIIRESAQPEKDQKEEEPSEDGAPAGYEYRQVELGLSDRTYIEIVNGLEEGEILAIDPANLDPMAPMGGMSVMVG